MKPCEHPKYCKRFDAHTGAFIECLWCRDVQAVTLERDQLREQLRLWDEPPKIFGQDGDVLLASYKGTGRTTRMLDEAAWFMRSGSNVLVVVEGESVAEQMAGVFAQRNPEANRWDQKSCRLCNREVQFAGRIRARRDDRTDVVVLLDHWVVESRFGLLLKQWLLWSAPGGCRTRNCPT